MHFSYTSSRKKRAVANGGSDPLTLVGTQLLHIHPQTIKRYGSESVNVAVRIAHHVNSTQSLL